MMMWHVRPGRFRSGRFFVVYEHRPIFLRSVSTVATAEYRDIQKARRNARVDAGTLKSVQIKIDNGSWITAIGTESWSYSLNTSNIKDGNHIISIRSYDGVGYSSTEMINITVQNIQEIDSVTPGLELTIALFALVFILFWKRKRKR